MSFRRPSGLSQLGAALAALAIVLFVIAGLFKSATAGAPLLMGNIAWFGFLLALASLIVVLATAGVRGFRRRGIQS